MKLQQGKWYVCTRSWSDDGWTKYFEGSLVLCSKDGLMVDVYGIGHVFDEAEAGIFFREATDTERNIASATEVDMDDFLESVIYNFNEEDTLLDIYLRGAENMLMYIRSEMYVNKEED